MTMANEEADMPRRATTEQEMHPEGGFDEDRADEADGIEEPADDEDLECPVAVAEGAGDRLPDAPDEVLDGEGEGERLAAPFARVRHVVLEEAEGGALAEGDEGDRGAAGEDEGDRDVACHGPSFPCQPAYRRSARLTRRPAATRPCGGEDPADP